MIKIENTDIHGWETAIRGARNPMNSWEKSDTWFIDDYRKSDYEDMTCHSINIKYAIMEGTGDLDENNYEICSVRWFIPDHGSRFKWDAVRIIRPYAEGQIYYYPVKLIIGPNDHKLLMNLCKGGSEESKWRRFVNVSMDITAPLYWWKEFDTYKVGTVCNSCSTMHKIQAKEFMLDDFSCEHLIFDKDVPDEEFENLSNDDWNALNEKYCGLENSDFVDYNQFPGDAFEYTIDFLNRARALYLKTKDKKYWWQMIQLLPSSYNQRRTIQLNYEVLAKQYKERKEHKLDEWRDYCEWIKRLPYSEFITIEETA